MKYQRLRRNILCKKKYFTKYNYLASIFFLPLHIDVNSRCDYDHDYVYEMNLLRHKYM